MEHRTDSTPTQSHGCLVALVLLGVLLTAFACSPVSSPSPPPPAEDESRKVQRKPRKRPRHMDDPLAVDPAILSRSGRGRRTGPAHVGPRPRPGPEDYYAGDFEVLVVHRIDHCDRIAGTDPWSFRFFRTVKDARAQRFRPCDYCIRSYYQ